MSEETKQTESAASDVPTDVRIELGRRRLPIDFFMICSEGSLIELPDSKLNQDGHYTADLRANDALVARGEVVVVDVPGGTTHGRQWPSRAKSIFGMRVTEVLED